MLISFRYALLFRVCESSEIRELYFIYSDYAILLINIVAKKTAILPLLLICTLWGPCSDKTFNQYKLGFKDHLHHAASSFSNDSISKILCICSNVSLTCRNIVVQLWIFETYDASLFTDIRIRWWNWSQPYKFHKACWWAMGTWTS